MPPVVIRPKALEDLAEIWACIAGNSPRPADAFAAAIDREIRGLARRPLIGRARPELLTELRSLPFGRYVIFYLPRKRGIRWVLGAPLIRGVRMSGAPGRIGQLEK